MPSNASVVKAVRVGFRLVNAEELLSRLVARGVARDVQPGADIRRAVRFKHIEAAAAAEPAERHMRARWRARVRNSDISYLLIADGTENSGSVLALGLRTADEPIRSVDCTSLAAVIEEAAAFDGLNAVRHIGGEVVRLADGGMVVHGLLTRHTLESRLLGETGFQVFAAQTLEGLRVEGDWRTVLNGLGYQIERLEPRGYLARFDGRPAAVVHPKADPRDFMRLDEAGRPAEGVLAADCRARGARYGILVCQHRYRPFDCDPSASAAEWLDLPGRGQPRRCCTGSRRHRGTETAVRSVDSRGVRDRGCPCPRRGARPGRHRGQQRRERPEPGRRSRRAGQQAPLPALAPGVPAGVLR